jgi:hypothetical protein
MLTRMLALTLVTLGLFALAGCENNEACEKERLIASTKWKDVMDSASKLKLTGGLGYDDLDATRKAQHHEAFAEIEKQAQMVFESFAFQKITWNTANPAREKANQAFESYGGKGDYRGFQTTLAGANKQFDKTAGLCK